MPAFAKATADRLHAKEGKKEFRILFLLLFKEEYRGLGPRGGGWIFSNRPPYKREAQTDHFY